jgi:multidrug/hemolysin transport system permease protein
MISLIKRNLKVYLKDKGAVFFSFLSIIIILALFILFLNNMHTTLVPDQFQGSDSFYQLMYSWAFAGVLMVGTFTVPIGFLEIMVKDFETDTVKDFFSSPLSKLKIILSYLISSVIVTILLSIFNLVIGKIVLTTLTNFTPDILISIQLILAIILSSILFSSIFFYISTKFKTTKSYGALGTLMGTLIGFITGLYVPLGSLQGPVATIINLLPTMQIASVFRKIYMQDVLTSVFAGNEQAMQEYANYVGVNIEVFGFNITLLLSVLIASILSVIFIALSLHSIKKK